MNVPLSEFPSASVTVQVAEAVRSLPETGVEASTVSTEGVQVAVSGLPAASTPVAVGVAVALLHGPQVTTTGPPTEIVGGVVFVAADEPAPISSAAASTAAILSIRRGARPSNRYVPTFIGFLLLLVPSAGFGM